MSTDGSSRVSGQGIKRRASTLDLDETSRKKLKEEQVPTPEFPSEGNADGLAEDLAQELQCGCCGGIVWRPVIVWPCQHFFCGSCCMLWIRNGGTNCPACRGVSTIVTPFRPLQSTLDTLLRYAPHKARTERERQQADEIYKAGGSMRIPLPREPSPEPTIPQSSEFINPCPHCTAQNSWGWTCPQPIPDPSTDADHAWRADAGTPPGHAHCGNCENLLALAAPTTSKCDLCQVSFCGIAVPGRCSATSLLSQSPSHFTDIADLILSSDVYDCFNGNTVEVEIMLDYLTTQRLTPAHIYRAIVQCIQSQPRGFLPLIEMDLFMDLHSVAAGTDSDPQAPRRKICKPCASEVLLYGLKAWWTREHHQALLQGNIQGRKDCPDGSDCSRQKDLAHAKEFNHIMSPAEVGDTRPGSVEGTEHDIPDQSSPPLVNDKDDIRGPVTDEESKALDDQPESHDLALLATSDTRVKPPHSTASGEQIPGTIDPQVDTLLNDQVEGQITGQR